MTLDVHNITPEEIKRQVEFAHRNLTADKYCCVCANSADKPDTEMGYPIERCYCSINGEYCPTCGYCYGNVDSFMKKYNEVKYCFNCGQKILWSKNEKDNNCVYWKDKGRKE